MNKEELIKFVKGFPDKPGVYLMRDEHGDIIYIGKAKSLKKRVSSYFRHSNFASPRLRKLVATIRDISTMRTESEIEALILENRLIKLYQPFFNVDLKMNERYAYIKITAEKYPRIVVTRIKLDDGAVYIGPYVRVQEVRALLRLVERYLPLRSCKSELDGRQALHEVFARTLPRALLRTLYGARVPRPCRGRRAAFAGAGGGTHRAATPADGQGRA